MSCESTCCRKCARTPSECAESGEAENPCHNEIDSKECCEVIHESIKCAFFKPISQSPWRSMDTAPTDGTRFLAWDKVNGQYTALYDRCAFIDSMTWRIAYPTHWQPLGPGPEGAE